MSVVVILTCLVWVFFFAYVPRVLSSGLRGRDPYPGWRNTSIVA